MGPVENPGRDAVLGAQATKLEADVRAGLAGKSRADLKGDPSLQAYARYYKRFGKTYHVQLQLESVAFKGRAIEGPSALVQAMFMAELKDLLLTAGHDLETIRGDLNLGIAFGTERYAVIGGGEQALKPEDMYIGDQEGILSSVIYGPAERARISPETRAVLFTVYVPPGIERQSLEAHLSDLERNVRLFSPRAQVELLEIIEA